jgi:Homeodomain-like domain
MKTKQPPKQKRVRVAVRLTPSDLAYLKGIVKSGTRKAREITRARILLLSHQKKSNLDIIAALGCSQFAISSLRRRFRKRKKDVKATIIDAPRSGTPKKILPAHEAFVVATACTDPPNGHAHWTAEALKDKLLETYSKLETISGEGIRRILLKNELKPWREKNVVHSKTHPAFS